MTSGHWKLLPILTCKSAVSSENEVRSTKQVESSTNGKPATTYIDKHGIDFRMIFFNAR